MINHFVDVTIIEAVYIIGDYQTNRTKTSVRKSVDAIVTNTNTQIPVRT